MNTITCSYDFPRHSRVAPRDDNTARILGRNRWTPIAGTVVGYCGRGEYCMVLWDNAPSQMDEATHWRNLRQI